MSEMHDNDTMVHVALADRIAEISAQLAGVNAMTQTVATLNTKMDKLLEWYQQEQVRAEMRAIWQRTIEGEMATLKAEVGKLRDEGLRWQLFKTLAVSAGTSIILGIVAQYVREHK